MLAQLLVGARVRGVVLAPVDRDRHHGVLEAAHARSVQTRPELEPEDVAARRAVDRQRGRSLGRDREIALAAELERLELDEHLVAVLLTGAKPELAQ